MKKVQGLITLIFIILMTTKSNAINIKEFADKDIYNTSIKISQEIQQEKTDTIILINEKSAVDAIIATPLVTIHNAPMLLINKDNIPIQIKNEIIKINPKNIILIGKDHTISQKVVDEIKSIIPNIKIDRIGGNSRYETSYIIAQKIHDENNIEEIYIGNGYDEADLLSIAPVAGNKKQPIVLTQEDKLDERMCTWLSDKNIKNAYFIGGQSSIDDLVIDDINKITTNDISKNRIAGSDRYETNANVIKEFYDTNLENIVVSYGSDIVSSVLGAQVGAKGEFPMLIVSKGNLQTSQVKLLDNIKSKNIYKVGSSLEDVIFNEVVHRLEFNEVDKGDSVIFFIPHQDDEMLSFSTTIKRYIDKGCDVKVVLMANGSKSKARLTLNGEDNRICGVHKYLHNPLKEGYMIENTSIEYIDEEILSDYRNDEFYRALVVMGVPYKNIYFSETLIDDNKLSEEIAIKGVKKILKKYPNSRVHTFFDENYSNKNHMDHVNLGKACKKLYDDGYIDQLYFHVEPYVYDDYVDTYSYSSIYEYLPSDDESDKIIKNAIKEYMIWDPKNGKLGVGYHSVRMYFEEAINNPVNYILKAKNV